MNTTSLSCCIACIIVCCQTLLSLAAPTAHRTRHSAADGETRLSLIVDSMADPLDLLARTEHVRNKRSVLAGEDLGLDLALPGEGELSPAVRRRRSTAAFWLHASLQLCNRFQNYCRRIEVDEGDVKIKLRLEDE